MIARFFLALCVLLAMSYPSFAADPASGQVMLGMKDVLRGNFTDERHVEGFNGPMKSSGHFVVAPGYGLIWAVEKPFPVTTIITPSGLVQQTGGTQVMKIPAARTPFLVHVYDTLDGALAGKWDALEKDFDVVRSGSVDHWQVDLTPHETNNVGMPFSAITIKGSRHVESALLMKPDGDSDAITFANEILTPAPPAAAEMTLFNSVGP